MQIYRSRSGRIIAAAAVGVMALSVAMALATQPVAGALVSLGPAALIGYLALTLFWFPRVEVGEDFVRIVNPARDVRISWGAIRRIDTRWALEITSDQGKFSAWGAPAPGRHSSIFASRDQGQHLPESTYLAGTVRPGDLITSDSGAAAAEIRRRWEASRDLGLRSEVAIKWHAGKLALLTALVVLNLFLL